MIRLLLFILLIGLALALGLELQQNPGYLLIQINHWSVEMNVITALVGMIGLAILSYLLLSIASRLLRFPSNLLRSWQNLRSKRLKGKYQQALIDYSEGNWSQSQKNLLKGIPTTDSPLFNYLAAARSAQELGHEAERDRFLQEAAEQVPEAKLGVELTKVQFLIEKEDWSAADSLLKSLEATHPQHPLCLKLASKIALKMADWQGLLKLLPRLKKANQSNGQELLDLERSAYRGLSQDALAAKQYPKLAEYYEALPKFLKYDPALVCDYAAALLKNQEYKAAEKLLRQALSKAYHEDFLKPYGQIPTEFSSVSFILELQKQKPESAAILLCLARLHLKQNLWGKAKGYLEESIRLKPSPEGYRELGLLLQRFGDREAACEAYLKGLSLKI